MKILRTVLNWQILNQAVVEWQLISLSFNSPCLNGLVEWSVVFTVYLPEKSASSHTGGIFLKTNINDARLNDLLRQIFSFFFLQCGGWLKAKPVSGRRTNRLLHGPVNHRLGNQQSPSDRKDAWCFKPLQASAHHPPATTPFLSIPRARA